MTRSSSQRARQKISQAATGALRERLIAKLGEEPLASPARRIHDDYVEASHLSEATSAYAHSGGRFPLTGTGIVNLYALFAELALRVVHADGRAGMLLPSGVASDANTAPFFRHVADGQLRRLVSFENEGMLLQGVHHAFKFCFIVIGGRREEAPVEMAFFLRSPEELGDSRRRFALSADDLRRLNPNTGTAPIFRSKADAELTAKIYRNVPVLWDETREGGNPWGLPVPSGSLQHDERLRSVRNGARTRARAVVRGKDDPSIRPSVGRLYGERMRTRRET